MGSSMKQTMKENSEDMLIKQRNLQLQIREIQLSTQFAMGKDRFYFFSGFYLTVFIVGMVKFKISKNPSLLLPLIPLSFAWAYQFDMYYLNKMERIRKEAGRILKYNNEMFAVPESNRLISEDEYRKIFLKQKEENEKNR